MNYHLLFGHNSTFGRATRVGIYFINERSMYLIDPLIAIDLSQFLLLAIVIKHLDSLIKINDQAPAHGLTCIVRALVELAAIQIANATYFRGTVFDMVDMLIRLAEKSTSNPLE